MTTHIDFNVPQGLNPADVMAVGIACHTAPEDIQKLEVHYDHSIHLTLCVVTKKNGWQIKVARYPLEPDKWKAVGYRKSPAYEWFNDWPPPNDEPQWIAGAPSFVTAPGESLIEGAQHAALLETNYQGVQVGSILKSLGMNAEALVAAKPGHKVGGALGASLAIPCLELYFKGGQKYRVLHTPDGGWVKEFVGFKHDPNEEEKKMNVALPHELLMEALKDAQFSFKSEKWTFGEGDIVRLKINGKWVVVEVLKEDFPPEQYPAGKKKSALTEFSSLNLGLTAMDYGKAEEKMIAHGLAYGMGPEGIAKILGVPKESVDMALIEKIQGMNIIGKGSIEAALNKKMTPEQKAELIKKLQGAKVQYPNNMKVIPSSDPFEAKMLEKFGTHTGSFKSSKPNFQELPKKGGGEVKLDLANIKVDTKFDKQAEKHHKAEVGEVSWAGQSSDPDDSPFLKIGGVKPKKPKILSGEPEKAEEPTPTEDFPAFQDQIAKDILGVLSEVTGHEGEAASPGNEDIAVTLKVQSPQPAGPMMSGADMDNMNLLWKALTGEDPEIHGWGSGFHTIHTTMKQLEQHADLITHLEGEGWSFEAE